MNKELEDRYLNVIENNVNVSKTNVGVEFFFMLAAIVIICFTVYFSSGLIASFCIDRMSNETQLKLEKMLSSKIENTIDYKSDKMDFLEEIKPKIAKLDKNLQGKSIFPLYVTDDEEVNAFVMPDGKIYFTKGLLKKIDNDEALTFVLAHEMGHYANRDHLKSVGRDLLAGTLLSVITLGENDLSSVVEGLTDINSLSHTKSQEEQADLYANHVLFKLYGENKGAVEFFEMLKKEEDVPEFFSYFSTHPSTDRRIYLIRHNR